MRGPALPHGPCAIWVKAGDHVQAVSAAHQAYMASPFSPQRFGKENRRKLEEVARKLSPCSYAIPDALLLMRMELLVTSIPPRIVLLSSRRGKLFGNSNHWRSTPHCAPNDQNLRDYSGDENRSSLWLIPHSQKMRSSIYFRGHIIWVKSKPI